MKKMACKPAHLSDYSISLSLRFKNIPSPTVTSPLGYRAYTELHRNNYLRGIWRDMLHLVFTDQHVMMYWFQLLFSNF